MASAGLLALIDDIATLLDDVALLTKVAARKTAGVLSDDLALNAEQVSGVRAERELPVVWAVAKGSAKNKLILVPAALVLSAIAPWVITPILMLGGAFLCFEGFEKIAHRFMADDEHAQQAHKEKIKALSDPAIDLVAFEQNKIKGAIRTDFILSAEIVVIALATVQEAPISQQVMVVSLIAALITIGVYGVVAGIVKLDDAGLYLLRSEGEAAMAKLKRKLGRGILSFCPYLMKTLSVVGTAAMFLVGGGILLHGMPHAHELQDTVRMFAETFSSLEIVVSVAMALFSAGIGVVAGAIIVGGVFVSQSVVNRLRTKG